MISDSSLNFLKTLLATPSPSGFEREIRGKIADYVAPFADTVTTDALGNLIACINPSGSPRIMLQGHMDELGVIIVHISDDGCCYFKPIGGWDTAVLIGQRVSVHTRGGIISGVIGRKPIHLMTADEKGKGGDIYDLWIDIGATGGKDEVKAAGVRVGDPATIEYGMTPLLGDRIAARALDNRIGAWIVMEALRRVKERHPSAAVYAVATVQEEIGLRGAGVSAYGIAPDLGIAVDVTFASDMPGTDKRRVGDIKIGGGPTISRGAFCNRPLADRLESIAEEHGLLFQYEASPGSTGTDADAIQNSRAGIATGVVGIPLRYMHTPCEIISLTDADNAAELLALTCASLSINDDWTP